MNNNIFEMDISGEQIFTNDPEHKKIVDIILESQKIIAELNNSYKTPDEIRNIISKLTGVEVDETLWLMPPFYTDFGKNIRFGKNVFVNHLCTFMDRGGINIEDDVFIGPKVNLITTNHPVNPLERKSTISKPIHIKKNVWVGVGATILSGVTIGENSVIGALSLVNKDVPANSIIGGVPAKVLRSI